MKEERIGIRTSAEAKALLRRAAQAQKLSLSQFLLQASLAAAEAVVPEPEATPPLRVSSAEYDWLSHMLASPSQNLPELQRLLNEPTEWTEDDGFDD